MENTKVLEETLREASCLGDLETVEALITKGVNVNSKNEINGWAPLHWAAKRNKKEVVKILLANGADQNVVTNKGEVAVSLCTDTETRKLLGADKDSLSQVEIPPLPITPHYLTNPPLLASVSEKEKCKSSSLNTSALRTPTTVQHTNMNQADEMVLKVRVANSGDPDFIEVEFPRQDLTYSRLLRTCCEELGVNVQHVVRVRKLPNTIVRKDKDVQRFHNFQEVELVVASTVSKPNGLLSVVGNKIGGPGSNVNGFQSISMYKNQTILY